MMAATATARDVKGERATSVDVLRGLIIVIMALDHVRDFFSSMRFQPEDLQRTTAALFATRWITHFCAPTFMLLAGLGAYLSLSRGKSKRELSRFLLTRGLWLALLDVTYMRVAMFFNFDFSLVLINVLWALGWSMVLLAALIWLPVRVLAVVSVAGICLHNALDGLSPAAFGGLAWLWRVLHVPGLLGQPFGAVVVSGYVLIPWIFVMSLGYSIGPVFRWESKRRKKVLLWSGAAMIAAFIVIRGLNVYGDPRPWKPQADPLFTVISFLNCTKYPPSLCFLLMTLGPATLLLAVFENWTGRVRNFLLVFGRVPLFFFLLHFPLIHALAAALTYARFGTAHWLFENPKTGAPFDAPPGFGYSLPMLYLIWMAIVAMLYPLCRWFAEYKRTHRAAWLSYL